METTMYLASNLPHMQTFGKVYRNFHVPCNETYVTLARYMEISMYLEMKHMVGYMEISMYVSCDETYDMVHGNFPVPCNETYMVRYMEISMYLANRLLWKHMAGYMAISIPCHTFRCKVTCEWRAAKTYTYQCIRAAQRNMEISVDLH